MSSSLAAWFAKIPRNTQEIVQRLTLYGWLRLALIVVAYLLVRPWLMKLAERQQERAHEQVVNMRPPGLVEDEETGHATSTGSEGKGNGGRKRQGKGKVEEEEALKKGVAMEDADEDVEFLKRYCVERNL